MFAITNTAGRYKIYLYVSLKVERLIINNSVEVVHKSTIRALWCHIFPFFVVDLVFKEKIIFFYQVITEFIKLKQGAKECLQYKTNNRLQTSANLA